MKAFNIKISLYYYLVHNNKISTAGWEIFRTLICFNSTKFSQNFVSLKILSFICPLRVLARSKFWLCLRVVKRSLQKVVIGWLEAALYLNKEKREREWLTSNLRGGRGGLSEGYGSAPPVLLCLSLHHTHLFWHAFNRENSIFYLTSDWYKGNFNQQFIK